MAASPFQFGKLNLWGYLYALVTQYIPSQVFGSPIIIQISAVNLTGDMDVIVKNKMRVTDAYCVNSATGGAGDTITVKNGTAAITDAMDCNKADNITTRAAQIVDSAWTIAAGGTLRVTGTSAVNAHVFITGVLVA